MCEKQKRKKKIYPARTSKFLRRTIKKLPAPDPDPDPPIFDFVLCFLICLWLRSNTHSHKLNRKCVLGKRVIIK
jgi:hypothetical protein